MGDLMHPTLRSGLLVVVASLGLFAAPASAAPRATITGALDKPGYTVIALSDKGRAKSVRVTRASFKLRAPAKAVTLHLRAADGVYAGPVVVGRAGGRTIVGVRAGARLGKVRVGDGYAKVARRMPRRWLDVSHWARARRGVPIGAGRFGRVRARPPRKAVPGDRDVDGIPNGLDIDDDGDLILDSVDRRSRARASQTQNAFRLSSSLWLELQSTANANAPGLTDAQIEAALPKFGVLGIDILPGDLAELDCGQAQERTDPTLGGLAYCTRGGTGMTDEDDRSRPFPGGAGGPFDADGDGFGMLFASVPASDCCLPYMFLRHGASSAQIGTGDLLIERVMSGGIETHHLATLQYVFATGPALVSYDDGRGNSATLSYPVVPGAPGTKGNGFPVRARANGDVLVTFTFWRPQRRPIRGEPGHTDPPTAWTDVGRLEHTAGVAEDDWTCQQGAYSNGSAELIAGRAPGTDGGGFMDQAPDRPAQPDQTFTYTLNLTDCLKNGINDGKVGPGLPFAAGQERGIVFSAVSPSANSAGYYSATLNVFFRRQ